MNAPYSIGIDVGGTKTALGLFASDGVLIERTQYPSNKTAEPEAFFDELAEHCKKLIQSQNLTVKDLDGIGIGMPSFVLFSEGRILKTSNLTNIRDFPARDYFSERFENAVRIVIDNDAHTGALAEFRHGAGQGFEHMLFCPVSTGISSGIIPWLIRLGGRKRSHADNAERRHFVRLRQPRLSYVVVFGKHDSQTCSAKNCSRRKNAYRRACRRKRKNYRYAYLPSMGTERPNGKTSCRTNGAISSRMAVQSICYAQYKLLCVFRRLALHGRQTVQTQQRIIRRIQQ